MNNDTEKKQAKNRIVQALKQSDIFNGDPEQWIDGRGVPFMSLIPGRIDAIPGGVNYHGIGPDEFAICLSAARADIRDRNYDGSPIFVYQFGQFGEESPDPRIVKCVILSPEYASSALIQCPEVAGLIRRSVDRTEINVGRLFQWIDVEPRPAANVRHYRDGIEIAE